MTGESNNKKMDNVESCPIKQNTPPPKKNNKSPDSFIYTQEFSIQPQCMGIYQKVLKCAYIEINI